MVRPILMLLLPAWSTFIVTHVDRVKAVWTLNEFDLKHRWPGSSQADSEGRLEAAGKRLLNEAVARAWEAYHAQGSPIAGE